MVKVRFYGALKQFGTEFNLEVNNTAEIVRALTSQIPNLRQFLQQGLFKVRIGKDYLDSRYLEKGMFYQLKEGMSVCFTPVLKGSKKAGLFQTIVGAVMVVVGYAMSWTGVGAVVGNLGVGLLLGGVSQMLTKMPSMPGMGNEQEKKNSTSFSNLSNMVAQGKPMPLAYGRIRTGALIISQGIETMDVDVAPPEQNQGRRRFGVR
ncbi:phage tail protein [Rodentibacter caecimuris]|uniref:Phage tail protein n=1 Tax=Rodentibacter caecimuris TaxID=1796644 RepID=A0AAJ3K269_9PAST|nr:tail assembly protein [Rodentibacter heylii]AOF54277.1 Phage tail assembly protein I [Pasteurellaceae bacterium NI1060]MCQ9122891.1 tail assembly protein [Rodentibacter heylii]OOF70035.1 phage tail protein [Rodentibacter heylii]OOF75404.1 phage tail protein [Rodentibacter heylii]OOF76259.1 phage tail protein [Rodentibacter heylii]